MNLRLAYFCFFLLIFGLLLLWKIGDSFLLFQEKFRFQRWFHWIIFAEVFCNRLVIVSLRINIRKIASFFIILTITHNLNNRSAREYRDINFIKFTLSQRFAKVISLNMFVFVVLIIFISQHYNYLNILLDVLFWFLSTNWPVLIVSSNLKCS